MSAPLYVFKVTAVTLAATILFGLVVSMNLQDRWEVATVRTIQCKPDRLAAVLGDLSTWERWYAAKVDLGNPTKATVEGAPGTVGHALVWTGPKGKASLSFTSVAPGSIVYDYGVVISDGQKGGRGTGSVRYAAAGEGCTVTWTDGGSWDGIVARWFGWFGALQERCKQIQAASLVDLQVYLEEQAKAAPGDGAKATAPASADPANTPR